MKKIEFSLIFLARVLAVGLFSATWILGNPLLPAMGQNARAAQEGPRIGGVGVAIAKVSGSIVIQQVVPGGPAERAGLAAGDVIWKVDGQETTGMPLGQVAGLITGPVGTSVALTVLRSDGGIPSARDVRVVRAPLPKAQPPQGDQAPRDLAKTAPRMQQLPAGFVRDQSVGGTGQILYARPRCAGSATRQLAAALADISSYFDRPLQSLHAFRDAEDRQALVGFRGTFQGQAISGIATSAVDGNEGMVRILFDRLERLGETFNQFVAALQRNTQSFDSIRSRRHQVRWYTALFPDGTGSIRLPEGWRITSSYKAAVDVSGPAGELMSLGIGIPIATPEGAMNPLTGMPMKGALVSSPMDPVSALYNLLPQFAVTTGGPVVENVRVVESGPLQSPTNGQAALVLWDFTIGGRPYRALSTIDCSPPAAGWWTFYYSTVTAPAERFGEQLPLMAEAWASGWHIDPKVFRERLQSALQSMRETHRLLTEAHATRTRAFDDCLADWTEVFRGDRVVRDTFLQEDRPVDIGWSRQIVDKLNERTGYQRYVEIPLRELNR